MNNTCPICSTDMMTQWEMQDNYWVSTSYCTRCGEKVKEIWETVSNEKFKKVPPNAMILPISEPADDFDNRMCISYRFESPEGNSGEFEVSYRRRKTFSKGEVDYSALEELLLHDTQLRKSIAKYFKENLTTLSREIENILIDAKVDQVLMEGLDHEKDL